MPNKTTTCTKKFPEKPITMIVAFNAGGGTDLLARAMEKVLVKYLGQPLVIVNKPGGTGTIGWNELTTSSPDGYTLGLTTTELLLQPLYGTTRYQYLTALEPIVQISTSPLVMIVQADQPWQNTNELIEYAKKHPGELKFAHSGVGSLPHVVGETFAKVADINIEQVPFRGASESTAALLGKHVQIAFMSPLSIKQQLENGTIRALAISSEQRNSDPILAQIPTFKEQGFDVIFNSWYGVAAPKELPPEIEKKLVQGFKAMCSDPEFKKSADALAIQIEYVDPKEFQEKWINDNIKLTKTIQETGILDRIKEQKK